ncbi:MAG: metallophosphatase family protein [Desulfobulbaceae bacterium]|nr:metallophosphatase family protein [Desulfobulbaceae bacterium]
MSATILLISDIHGNYPALRAVAAHCGDQAFDLILNCGDSTVYAPFADESLDWLRQHGALSILGNTDIKVLRLLAGKKMKKPRQEDKRVMYFRTAEHLTRENREFLAAIPNRLRLDIEGWRIGLFHGSPANDTEHIFADTPTDRFRELSGETDCDIIITGHSHSPYHKYVNNVHFINPGSVGRMFDGNPDASYAIVKLTGKTVKVRHYRCPYPVNKVIERLRQHHLPEIYEEMFRSGKKLN